MQAVLPFNNSKPAQHPQSALLLTFGTYDEPMTSKTVGKVLIVGK